jgi:hypothetical protein
MDRARRPSFQMILGIRFIRSCNPFVRLPRRNRCDVRPSAVEPLPIRIEKQIIDLSTARFRKLPSDSDWEARVHANNQGLATTHEDILRTGIRTFCILPDQVRGPYHVVYDEMYHEVYDFMYHGLYDEIYHEFYDEIYHDLYDEI